MEEKEATTVLEKEKIFQDEENIYEEEAREMELEDDEIDGWEDGWMKGYEKAK